eukprot:Opistho-2@24024
MARFQTPHALAASFVAVLSSTPVLATDPAMFAPVYRCAAFGGDGTQFDTFDVAIGSRSGGEFEVEILSTTHGSGKHPVTAHALASGTFEIVSRPKGPNGEPPGAFSPRTGVRFVFEGGVPRANGYAIIYKDTASRNVEAPAYHPVAAGICRPAGSGG